MKAESLFAEQRLARSFRLKIAYDILDGYAVEPLMAFGGVVALARAEHPDESDEPSQPKLPANQFKDALAELFIGQANWHRRFGLWWRVHAASIVDDRQLRPCDLRLSHPVFGLISIRELASPLQA
jgi:hypothetical protein